MDGYSLYSCCWRLLSTPQCPPTLQLWGLSTAGMHGAYQNWCAAVAAGDITRPRTTPVQGQPAITSGSSAQLQLCYAVGPHSPCSQCPVCCAWGQAPAGAPAAETEGCRSTSAPLQTAESTESGSGSSSPTDTGHAHAWEAAGTSRGAQGQAPHFPQQLRKQESRRGERLPESKPFFCRLTKGLVSPQTALLF